MIYLHKNDHVLMQLPIQESYAMGGGGHPKTARFVRAHFNIANILAWKTFLKNTRFKTMLTANPASFDPNYI